MDVKMDFYLFKLLKLSRRDKNRRPSTYKRLGGPGRGPETPGGVPRGSRSCRVANAVVK